MAAKRTGLSLLSLGLALSLLLVEPARAATITTSFTEQDRYASVVVDAESGLVLAASDADQILLSCPLKSGPP